MLAQLGARAGDQDTQPERLGDVIVGAGFQTQDGIGVGIRARQHDDRRFDAGLAHQFADFPSVEVRQADIQEDQIEDVGLGFLQRLGARGGFGNREFLVQTKLFQQRLAQGIVIIDKQDGFARCHRRRTLRSCPNNQNSPTGCNRTKFTTTCGATLNPYLSDFHQSASRGHQLAVGLAHFVDDRKMMKA